MNKRIKERWYRKSVGGEWNGESFVAPDGSTDSSDLPIPVRDWAGLESADPKLSNRSNALRASVLNDRKETFAYIATRIEKYL